MDALIAILITLLGSLSLGGVVLLVVLLNPEKIEIWSALLWRFLDRFGSLFKSANKQYIKHDLQGRVNQFVKSLAKDAPFLVSNRVRVEWAESNVTRKSFLDDKEIVLRLRREDPEDLNFVNGAYMFISTGLLFKVKRYVSPSQRQAVDLYVTTKLLEREKPGVVSYFLDEYLHKHLDDPDTKTAKYYDQLAKIDGGGLFYPVLLQELDFLGNKVFGKRQDDKIITEVNSLVDFLEPIATRHVGQETDLNFERNYCRFAIVIVGKPKNMNPTGDIYIEFIRMHILPKKVETLYLLGLWENKPILDIICDSFNDVYDKCSVRNSKVALKYNDGIVERKQYLAVLRLKGINVFQPSE